MDLDLESIRFGCGPGERRDIWFLVADASRNFTDVPCLNEDLFLGFLVVFMLLKFIFAALCLLGIVYNDDNVARLYLGAACVNQGVELAILIGTFVAPLEFTYNSDNPTLPLLFAAYMLIVFILGIVLSYKIKVLTEGIAPRFLAQSKGFRMAANQTTLQTAVLVFVVFLAVVFCTILAAIPFSNRYQGVSWRDNGDLAQQDALWFYARMIHVVGLNLFYTVPLLHMYSLWQFMVKQRKYSASETSGASAANNFEQKLRFGLIAMVGSSVPGTAMSVLGSDKIMLGPTVYLVLIEFFIGNMVTLMILIYFFPFYSFKYCRDDYIKRTAGSTTREGSLTIHNI